MRETAQSQARTVVVLLLLLATARSGSSEVRLTTDEALALAFPGCSVEREIVYLTDEQREAARDLAGAEIEVRVLHPHVAHCPDEDGELAVAGTAYFDVHRVRTLSETLMIVVSPEGMVQRIEILRFDEPPDYIPRQPWYDQFDQQKLDSDLQLKREIRPVTGATLTAQVTTAAVRRILALHQILSAPPATTDAQR